MRLSREQAKGTLMIVVIVERGLEAESEKNGLKGGRKILGKIYKNKQSSG